VQLAVSGKERVSLSADLDVQDAQGARAGAEEEEKAKRQERQTLMMPWPQSW
jgi:hypothetical protein